MQEAAYKGERQIRKTVTDSISKSFLCLELILESSIGWMISGD